MHDAPSVVRPGGTRGRRGVVVSIRASSSRVDALRRLLGAAGAADVTVLASPPTSWDGVDAVVIDGPQPSWPDEAVCSLGERVGAGAVLLALGGAPADPDSALGHLLGVAAAAPPLPAGEVFAKPVAASGGLVRRLDAEFPLVDAFQPLAARNGVMRPVLQVSVGFRDRAAVLEGRRGAGRVVVAGLGNSDAALAHPALATLLRRALDGAVPDEEAEIGVGIVGYGPYGGMGYAHGLAVSAVEGLRLAAVCDRSPERRDAAGRDFPGVRPHADLPSLLADPEVGVVIVATPPVQHAALCLEVLRAGRHAVCEKPLCLTVADADRLIDTAAAAGTVLTVNQNRRWDGDFLALRGAVDAGRLGSVFNVETFVGGFAHPCRAWHSDVEHSGGAVYDWGSHHVDWILQLMPGMPAEVTAVEHKRVWHDVTNVDQLRVRLRWDDGREAEFLQSDVAAIRRPKLYVQGTEGTAAGWYREVSFERIEPGRGYVRETAHHAEAPVDLTLARYESGHGLVECRIPPVPDRGLAFHRNLADHLHLGEPLAVTPESVRRVVAVLEAATASAARRGAPVAVASR